jgi:hypothetical protein
LYVAIAIATHFAIKFILLLGVAEHLDSDVLSSLLLYVGFLSAFLTRSRFGLDLLAAAFSIKLIVSIVSSVQKRCRKRALTAPDFSSAPPR